jgi:uncharacterized protein (DUF952 family)
MARCHVNESLNLRLNPESSTLVLQYIDSTHFRSIVLYSKGYMHSPHLYSWAYSHQVQVVLSVIPHGPSRMKVIHRHRPHHSIV